MPDANDKATYNIDSKFRRETSNFKIDFATKFENADEDPDPVLIKYIEKNLTLEDLLGTVVRRDVYDEGDSEPITIVWVVAFVSKSFDNDRFVYLLSGGNQSMEYCLYYIPSTGALSLYGPYDGGASEDGGGGGSEGEGGSIIK